jgi:Protein of unknown function (DUF3108)
MDWHTGCLNIEDELYQGCDEMAVIGKLIVGVFSAGFLIAGSALAADTVAVDYDVSLAGSRIMKANYSAQLDDEKYAANLSAKTVGVSKVFSKIKLNLSASGRFTKNGLVPVQYGYFRKKNDKTKERNLQFNGDGSLKTDGAGYEQPILAAVKKSIMDKPCSGKHRSFDGRDVFDISLTTVSADNGRLVCKLVYQPIAGGDVDDGETEPVTYSITLAPTNTAQNYVAVSVSGSSKGVPFSVDARSVSVNGAALSF